MYVASSGGHFNAMPTCIGKPDGKACTNEAAGGSKYCSLDCMPDEDEEEAAPAAPAAPAAAPAVAPRDAKASMCVKCGKKDTFLMATTCLI